MRDGKKNVLLAVSGSIAAYKACDIARAFIKDGVSVTVTLTENGARFVTPITFETLTNSKCLIDTFDRNFTYEVEHISAAKAADVCLIAPASANIIGKIANGIADDMATTTIMAASCPKLIAPAMNTAMYDNPIVQENLEKLIRHGYKIITPDTGLLACGDVGRGKLAPVEEIVEAVRRELYRTETSGNAAGETDEGAAIPQDFAGRKVLVTAGPTQEALDPVRYITNHSSGKMGYALAEAARDRGADVVLISGPVALAAPENVSMRPIVSAADMAEAVFAEFESADVLIMAAAVADYRPKAVADQKIKKKDGGMSIELERTTDILGTLADKKTHQFVCGFSMETENLIENSRNKLVRKKLDMIAANSIRDEGAGFAHDTNRVTIITQDDLRELPLISKKETAHRILDAIAERI